MPRAFTHQEAAAQMLAAGAEPLEEYQGANSPWECRCLTCGRIGHPRLNSVRLGRGPCVFCARQAAKGRYRTSPDDAVVEMRQAGAEPLEPFPGAATPWRVRCLACRTTNSKRLRDVRSGQGPCVACARANGREKMRGPADLAADQMRAAGAEPLEPFPGVKFPWKVRCLKCGATVSPRLANIRRGDGPCVHCGRKSAKGRFRTSNEDATTEMIAAGAEPQQPFPGSHGKWRVVCLTCGREVVTTLHDVRGGHRPCGWCAGQRVDPGVRAQAMRTAGVEPLEDYRTAWTKWRCRCLTCGRTVTPTYAGVSQGEWGCRTCAKARGGLARRNDAAEAVAFMRAANLEPLEDYRGSGVPWRCKCLICGNEVTPRLTSVQRGQGGCKFCSGKAIDEPRVVEALAAMGYVTLEPIVSSKTRLRVHCRKCEQDVTILYGQVLARYTGCPGCSKNTFSTVKPSIMYVLIHEEFLAYKVGIMNQGTTRLQTLGRYGWAVITRFTFDSGRQAKDAESEMLRWVRLELRLPPHMSREQMPYRGENETFSSDAISVQALLDRARTVASKHGGREL